MPISSLLEANRAEEIDTLLTLLHPKIVAYVRDADTKGALGTYHEPHELKKIFAENTAVFAGGIRGDTTQLMRVLDDVLRLSVNTWSPGFMDKLYATNNPIGVVADLVLSLLNTNSHVYTVSPVLSVVENFIGHRYAAKFYGDSATCGGLTFPGGLWSNITAMHMARALKYPATKLEGNALHRFAVYTSAHCHYSVEKAAILLGLGSHAVFKIAVAADGTMDPELLEKTMADTVAEGYTPLFVNATAGTTVFGLYDGVEAIACVAKRHGAWLHVDGSWGGNVVFSQKHRHKVAGCHLADSITVNPHKMLGVPNTCSFLLVPDVALFQRANSLVAPYLFHSGGADENMDLADGTMGCGRRADAFKFYLAWLYYGEQGFALRIDHAFEIARYFVQQIKARPGFSLVALDPQCLQVCFYYVPESFTGRCYTDVTRYVSRELHRQGKFLVDFSPNPSDDAHGEFFRVVFNLPILTDATVDELVESVVEIAQTFGV